MPFKIVSQFLTRSIPCDISKNIIFGGFFFFFRFFSLPNILLAFFFFSNYVNSHCPITLQVNEVDFLGINRDASVLRRFVKFTADLYVLKSCIALSDTYS